MAGAATDEGGGAERTPAKSVGIVVIGAARDATAAARIAAELRAFGFTAEVRRVASAPDAAEGERALRAGARAIVQLDGRAARTEVAIADPTGRTLGIREVLEGRTAAIDALLITRTVELVRATLLASPPAPENAAPLATAQPTSTTSPSATTTAGTAPTVPRPSSGTSSSGPTAPEPSPAPATVSSPPSAPSPPPSAPSPPPSPPPTAESDVGPRPPFERGEPRWRTAVSAGVSAASGGLAPEVVLGVLFAARVAGPLHVELLGVAPLTSSPTSTQAGASRSTAWVFGGGPGARWRRRRIALDAGAGALAIWLRSVGSVPAPTPESPVANTDGGLGAAAYARAGASLALGRTLAARVDFLAGDVFRRPVLRFGETGEPAAWGPAFMVALAGIELRW